MTRYPDTTVTYESIPVSVNLRTLTESGWSFVAGQEGCRKSRRYSRDTYPESYITKYTSIRRVARGRCLKIESEVADVPFAAVVFVVVLRVLLNCDLQTVSLCQMFRLNTLSSPKNKEKRLSSTEVPRL